jgi:transposase InsO family protein
MYIFACISLSFNAWLQESKSKRKRQRTVMTDELYEELLTVLRSGTPAPTSKHLKQILEYNQMILFHNRLAVWQPQGKLECGGDVLKATFPKHVKLVKKESEWEELISLQHTQDGHAYFETTYVKLSNTYHGIKRAIVKAFAERCGTCAQNKMNVHKSKRRWIRPILTGTCFKHLQMDLINKSRDAGGADKSYKYIMRIVDMFSKYSWVYPLKNKTAEEVHFVLCWFFGNVCPPTIFQSDNGSEFKNELVNALMESNGVEYRHGQPYKPSTQGVVERSNGTLQDRMAKMINDLPTDQQSDWLNVLWKANHAMNCAVHTTTDSTPFRMLYGMDPPVTKTSVLGREHEYEQPTESIDAEKTHERIRSVAHTKSMIMSQNYCDIRNAKSSRLADHHVGQYVGIVISERKKRQVRSRNIPGIIIDKKSDRYLLLTEYGVLKSYQKHEAFFAVECAAFPHLHSLADEIKIPEKLNNIMQQERKSIVQLCTSMRRTANMNSDAEEKHESDMTDVSDTDEDAAARDAYGVPERIVGERTYRRCRQYLIHWIDYDESFDSWERAEQFDSDEHFADLVQDWKQRA